MLEGYCLEHFYQGSYCSHEVLWSNEGTVDMRKMRRASCMYHDSPGFVNEAEGRLEAHFVKETPQHGGGE